MDSLADGIGRALQSLFFYPAAVQDALLAFVWAAEDGFWLASAKRIALLIPAAAVIFASWVCLPCLVTMPFRRAKRIYGSALIVAWWDLVRGIFIFWAGLLKFTLTLSTWAVALLRIVAMGLWLIARDLVHGVAHGARKIGRDYFGPGVPWVAVSMTLAWVISEALLLVAVAMPKLSPLMGAFSSVIGSNILVWISAFILLFILVLSSFAGLVYVQNALQQQNRRRVGQFVLLQSFVMIFEVSILYRGLIASVVDWYLGQSASAIPMTAAEILLMAALAWTGIRSTAWVLFANVGTPAILDMIRSARRHTVTGPGTAVREEVPYDFHFIKSGARQLREDMLGINGKGDELQDAFLLPPLQIFGALVNFCALIMSHHHLFELPFQNVRNLPSAANLLVTIRQKTKA